MPSAQVFSPEKKNTMRDLGWSAMVLLFCFASVWSLGNLDFDMPACDNPTGNSTNDNICREDYGPDMYTFIGLWLLTSTIDSALHYYTKPPFKCDKQAALTISKCINVLMPLLIGSIAVGTQSWEVCKQDPCEDPYFRISDFVAPLLANAVFYAACLYLASWKSTTSKSGLSTKEDSINVTSSLITPEARQSSYR